MDYEVGEKVEVIGKENGFEGSYYAAKVISKEGTNQYKVEYETLLKEDESGPLQEVLDSDALRPEPPHIPNDAFSLEEIVDAYEKDGWWIGLIEGKFAADYFVQFPGVEDEVPFPLKNLRVHLEWSKGKWKPSSTYKKRIKNTLDYRLSCQAHGGSRSSSGGGRIKNNSNYRDKRRRGSSSGSGDSSNRV